MTINSATRTAGPFSGNGSTTIFPFSFKVFARSDLLVATTVTATSVETIKVLDLDYTVTLNANQNVSPGGIITMAVAPPTGTTLAATSNIPVTQNLDLTNQGGFYPTVINNALDRIVIQIQQLTARVGLGALNIGASAAIASTLAFISTLAAAGGAGLVGFLYSSTYAAGTIGKWLKDLATSAGSGFIGFLQSGVGAVLQTVQGKLRQTVSITDFMTDAERADALAGTLTLDLGPAIQKALDSKSNYLRVINPGLLVRSNQGLVIKGNYKTLESEGGGYLDFHGNNLTCISIEPTTPGTQTFFSGVRNMRIFGDSLTGTSNIGVKVSGTAFNVLNENLDIRYIGLGTGNDGYGYLVAGAPTPGDYSPQMGVHRNIRAIACGNGILFDSGSDISGFLTQQIIENTYTADCKGFGTQFKNVTLSSMVGVSSESCTGDELVVDGGFSNTWIGGMIDGTTALLNRDSSGRDNLMLTKIFPSRATVFAWQQLPCVWLGDIFTAARTGIPLVNMAIGNTIDFTGIGVLSILTRSGAWCRVLLSQTSPGSGQFVEILEKGSTVDVWSTSSGNAGTINIYWVSGASAYRVQNNTSGGQVVSFHQLIEA